MEGTTMTASSNTNAIISPKEDNKEGVLEKESSREKKEEGEGNQAIHYYCEYHINLVSSYLPEPIADYIIERFCDDMDVETYKKVDFDSACQVCINTHKRLALRRYYERRIIAEIKEKKAEAHFLVSADWMMRWKLFLYYDTEDDKFLKQYFFDSLALPGSINNSALFADDGLELREDLAVV